MKKLLLIIFISATLLSCKKNKHCYNCTAVNPYEEMVRCGDPTGRYQDDQGEDMNCIEIHD